MHSYAFGCFVLVEPTNCRQVYELSDLPKVSLFWGVTDMVSFKFSPYIHQHAHERGDPPGEETLCGATDRSDPSAPLVLCVAPGDDEYPESRSHPSERQNKNLYDQWIGLRWFKGKFTGIPHIEWENLWFPVDFPLNQSIDTSTSALPRQIKTNMYIVGKNWSTCFEEDKGLDS